MSAERDRIVDEATNKLYGVYPSNKLGMKWITVDEVKLIEADYRPGSNPLQPTPFAINLEKPSSNNLSLTQVIRKGTERFFHALKAFGRPTLHRPQPRPANQLS